MEGWQGKSREGLARLIKPREAGRLSNTTEKKKLLLRCHYSNPPPPFFLFFYTSLVETGFISPSQQCAERICCSFQTRPPHIKAAKIKNKRLE